MRDSTDGSVSVQTARRPRRTQKSVGLLTTGIVKTIQETATNYT